MDELNQEEEIGKEVVEIYENFRKKNIQRIVTLNPFRQKKTISYGLIVYANDTKRTLLVKRKHTVQFMNIMCQNVRKSYIWVYMSEISEEESNMLRKALNSERYYKYAFKKIGLNENFFEYSKELFFKNSEYMKNIFKSSIFKGKLSWFWPKGKLLNKKENKLNCAIREFNEEIEEELKPFIFLSDQWIVSSFLSKEFKLIESHLLIYVVENEFEIQEKIHFHEEISERKWFNFSGLKNIIYDEDLLRIICNKIPKIYL